MLHYVTYFYSSKNGLYNIISKMHFTRIFIIQNAPFQSEIYYYIKIYYWSICIEHCTVSIQSSLYYQSYVIVVHL